MVECLNAAGVQYVCFGNHENDVPHPDLIKRIKESKFKWLNTNMDNLNLGGGITLPTYEIITLDCGRRIALLGLLAEEFTGYFNGAIIHPVIQKAEEYLLKLENEVDLIIPLTHQVISADRSFAEYFDRKQFSSKLNPNSNAFPLIIGGHDHEVYMENIAGCQIIKTGMDAKNVAICDIYWPNSETKRVNISTNLFEIETFPIDWKVKKLVDKHMSVCEELDRCPLFKCDDANTNGAKNNILSSKNTRFQQTTMGTKIASSVRDALGK